MTLATRKKMKNKEAIAKPRLHRGRDEDVASTVLQLPLRTSDQFASLAEGSILGEKARGEIVDEYRRILIAGWSCDAAKTDECEICLEFYEYFF